MENARSPGGASPAEDRLLTDIRRRNPPPDTSKLALDPCLIYDTGRQRNEASLRLQVISLLDHPTRGVFLYYHRIVNTFMWIYIDDITDDVN